MNRGVSAFEVTPIVLDMSTLSRWRLMRPETVAEELCLPMLQTKAEKRPFAATAA